MTSAKSQKVGKPHFAPNVEASGPNIIMRRNATSERTVTPASGHIISHALWHAV